MILKYEHLIGIPFLHGTNDCYSLIQKFFKDNFGIILRNYARPDNWWNKGLNLYLDNFRKEGFEPVDIPLSELRQADALLMAIGAPVACHAGVYIGEGKIVHHLFNRFSEVSPIRGPFRNNVCAIVRHKDVVIPKETPKKLDLMSLIPAHKRRQLESALENS